MRLTEVQLRDLIRQVINEDASGPGALKTAATSVIQAINEENPAAFWNAFSEVLEGLAGTVELAPGADNLERSKFIEAIKPAWNLVRRLTMAYRKDIKGPAAGNKKPAAEGVVREALEFEPSEDDVELAQQAEYGLDQLYQFFKSPELRAAKDKVMRRLQEIQEGMSGFTESVNEAPEPFDPDIVNQLVGINDQLDRLAFHDDKYDTAFEEISAVHGANKALIKKLRMLG